MSIRMMSAVWEQDDLDQSETLVMLALADWANDAGHCWPSMEQIAKKTRLSERGTRGIIRRLETKGCLKSEEVPGKGVNYWVIPRNYVPPSTGAPRNHVPPTPEPRSANTSEIHHTSSSTPTLESNLDGGANEEEDKNKGILDFTPKAPKRKNAWREGEKIPVGWIEWAKADRNWSVGEANAEGEAFVDSALANRRLYADWFAAWRNWCRSPYCKTEKGAPKKPLRIDRW